MSVDKPRQKATNSYLSSVSRIPYVATLFSIAVPRVALEASTPSSNVYDTYKALWCFTICIIVSSE